ncbi:hypothetical protein [Arenibacter algicola]|jgi:hypothetical protein|uniref:Uncharacterized protein n=1 Tax=Arenibacter algicola TaxID=616991 RepID=A0A221UT79_9FLAO|nr:hypothetical protein [Arenibacter algicola]ASO04589.1 hypothetical protein AREALGSMS7_01114 [Arenibacter algicola]
MKNQLLLIVIFFNLCSCVNSGNKIELVESNTFFEHKKDYQPEGGDVRDILKNIQLNKERPSIPNAYFISYVIELKNNTGENIEKAEIKSRLKIYYNNKTEIVNFNPLNDYHTIHYESSPIWLENGTISYSARQRFNQRLFLHNPNKIEIEIEIFVKNSVGFSHSEYFLLNDELMDSWNSMN